MRHRACLSGAGVNIRRSMAVRKAARVFPEPVGARSRVLLPAKMGGHPSACARVGEPKEASNQPLTGDLKPRGGEVRNVFGALRINGGAFQSERCVITPRREISNRTGRCASKKAS